MIQYKIIELRRKHISRQKEEFKISTAESKAYQ